MIQQTQQVGVGSGAAPFNVVPAQFNPTPEDGVFEVWACVDPLGSPSSADVPPSISVTFGGGTPISPVQPTAITTNTFGIVGGAPTEANRILSPQAVGKGTNTQVTISGGSQNYTVYIKYVFRTLQELSQGLGTVAQ
jgi:hypothetical protein